MEVHVEDAGVAVAVRLSGRLDTNGVDAIENRFLASTVAGGRDAIVDLSGVDLITSMGVRMLIGAARAMGQRKTKLVLFGAQDFVREVLETSAVDAIIALAGNEAEALAIVRH